MGQSESTTHDDTSGSESESESDAKPDFNYTVQLPTKWYDDQLLKRDKHIDFDVEAWYPIIQNETFYTEFIPMSPAIAQAFVNFYQTRYASKTLLTFDDIQLIESVQNQLKQQIFNSNRFRTNGTFIRLSSRSPKDGLSLNLEKMNQLYHRKLDELRTKYPDEYESVQGKANIQMIAYSDAQLYSMKVTDEIQALNLILSSERVYYDLVETLDCQKVINNTVPNVNNIKLHDWNNNIIIRQWHNQLDPSMEFRCFVHQSKLTAITQYDHYCKYHHLQDNATVEKIKLTIIKYWEERIKPLFESLTEKYANYVIDIGVTEKQESNEYDCIVIEMNPFETTTGASLFDWTEDIKQLTGQTNEIEIRVRLDYYPYLEDYIEVILEANRLQTEDYTPSNHDGMKPYFIFLDKIKKELDERD